MSQQPFDLKSNIAATTASHSAAMAEEMVISLEARTRSLASRIGSLESSLFVSQRAAETADVILEELTFKQEQMEAEIKQLETDFQDIRELVSKSQPSAKKMPMQRVIEKIQGPPLKKAKAAAYDQNFTKTVVVKVKPPSRLEPSF